MSHTKNRYLRTLPALAIITSLILHCARLGEAPITLTEQNLIPAHEITSTNTKPGMGSNGGPITWSFWVKSRTAASDAMLGSFTPFYKLNATRLAMTQNFVLYRDSGSAGTLLPFTATRNGTLTTGSATVTGLATTADLDITSNKKVKVKGNGIPDETYVASIVDANTITISKNATVTSTESLTFLGGATAILDTMEGAYVGLKDAYGGGEHPYANNGARVVILAYDIQDDYATTQNYVGGYFSPRDLYSNTFTMALFNDPVALQQYSNYIGMLGGYSNEMSIVNYDLSPGYANNPNQVNDIVVHELSHLFTYSKRVFRNRLANHDLWIAEGIAENAPHHSLLTHNVESLRLTQLASPSVIDAYQDAPQLTDFLTWATKIIGYLQSNLFFSYLRHRAEMQPGCTPATNMNCSSAMMRELMITYDQTIEGVEAIIKKHTSATSFAEFYGDFVATHYLMLLGIPVDQVGAVTYDATTRIKYRMDHVGIGASSATIAGGIKVKYPTNIPFNFDGPKCPDGTTGLKPNSYVIIRHKYDGFGDKATLDTPGAGALPSELPLQYIINTTTENAMMTTPPPTISLNTVTAGNPLQFSGYTWWNTNESAHIIIYNPNKKGSCRQFDPALIQKRNHSKWVGAMTCGSPFYSYSTNASPDYDWQTDVGACWANNQNGRYQRPAGIATFAGGTPPADPVPGYATKNFIYVTDYNNMSLQRLDLDKGTPLGRLGVTSNTCPSTGNNWDTNISRYQSAYCAHNFFDPQGIAVDPATSAATNHTIYVADASNRRIVKYDEAGNFQGWIGSGPCVAGAWKTAAAATVAPTSDINAEQDPCMFWVPVSVATDATNFYVVDNGKHRILKRDKTTGDFVARIGNNANGWNTSTALITAPVIAGSDAGFFSSPNGITIVGTNMYVVDAGNQRIVRIDLTTGTFTGWVGGAPTPGTGPVTGWQTSWTGAASSSSNRAGEFQNPAAIASDGTYLYIADRSNNRIVRWTVATGIFQGWLGHGKVGWETSQASPAADPYAGFSYYPPDYYAEPHGLAVAKATEKGTKRNYLYVTSVYNGRVTRINLDCAASPGSAACEQNYDALTP